MASSTSTTTPTKHAFESRCAEVRCRKEDLNTIILDYLTAEGYTDAATKFAMEANLVPFQSRAEIQARQAIKEAIHVGQIQDAINMINSVDYRILEQEEALHFALLRLQLIELIRNAKGDITPAITFSKKFLAPRAPQRDEFLADLEKAMALVIFPHDKLEPELAYLMDPKFRRDIADMVNRAMIERQRRRQPEAVIRDLIRQRQWAENVARKSNKDIPENIELGVAYNRSDSSDKQTSHTTFNGHEPMDT